MKFYFPFSPWMKKNADAGTSSVPETQSVDWDVGGQNADTCGINLNIDT
jgi:hypothetical protein